MSKKYLLKGLLLIFLSAASLYYFLNTPASQVTLSSFFILILTVVYIQDEFSLKGKRKTIERMIDQLTILVFLILSIDVLFSLFTKGISFSLF